jgi:DNA-directed RNA polymerase subunit alpha
MEVSDRRAVSLGPNLNEHLVLFVGLTDEAKDAEIMVEKRRQKKKCLR